MGTTKPSMGAFAAALLALLMLTYASAVSSVMQVEMAFAAALGPLCGVPQSEGAMADMAMSSVDMGRAAKAGPAAAGSKSPRGHQPACPFCAAAAHAPILGTVAPPLFATAFTFADFQLVASHGPRGPPTVLPKARGPPTASLTL